MKTKAVLSLVLFFFISSFWCSADAAPDIAVGEKQGSAGETISIPIDFTANGNCAHIQLDLSYDSSVLTPGTPTGESASSGHVVDSSVISPGHLRFVVYSFSNAQLGSGRLINLPISIASDALPDIYPLDLSAVVISDPTGQSVTPTILTGGSVEVIEESTPIPMAGPFGILLLACLIAWTAIKALKNPHSLSYRILVLFVLVNFSMCSLGLLSALAACPGDCDDDGDIDTDDMQFTVGVILERSVALGDPDCNQDGFVNVLDVPCQIKIAGNSPPVADAGDNQNVNTGDTVDLDGSGSSDVDSDPLTCQWAFMFRPFGSTAVLSNATSENPSFVPDLAGIYVVRLIVNDGTVASSPDTVTLTAQLSNPATVDKDGDGFSEDEGDFDDANFAVNPGATEICGNAIDEDCDGQIDDPDVCFENSPPAITSSAVTGANEGEPYTYDAEATDPDADDTLTFSLPLCPTGMSVNPDTGVIQWTPGADQTGNQDVTVKVKDNYDRFDTQTFIITVNAINLGPTANDDAYDARTGETLTVDAPGVLENDIVSNNDPLTAALITPPEKGTLDFNVDGSFDYTPTVPTPGTTEPTLKYGWENPDQPVAKSIKGVPLVIDLDKDGIAEIVFYDGCNLRERLTAIHGNDGSIMFSISGRELPPADPSYIINDCSLSAGDIDGDGYPEIIAVDGYDGDPNGGDPFRKSLHAFEHDGTYKWTSQDLRSHPLVTATGGFEKTTLADINGDGVPEIIVGYAGSGPFTPDTYPGQYTEFVTVFDSTGQIIWTAQGNNINEQHGPASGYVVVADIDLDGDVEILFGDDVYDHNGNLLWSVNQRLSEVVVANLDTDPFPELVYRQRSANTLIPCKIYVVEHDGTPKWGPVNMPADTGGAYGPLSIGDADGDGYVEILFASEYRLSAMNHDGTLAWSHLFPNPVVSGFATIFDLNADGTPEVVYHGYRGDTMESLYGALFIINGADGTILHRMPARRGSSASGNSDGPVVADVDGDGAAEIVVGNYGTKVGDWPIYALYVFEAMTGDWAPTRPVWNQHTYHVTNVNLDGTIPAVEQINWLTPGLNNWRCNVPLPEEDERRKDQFTYHASDAEFDSKEATVYLNVLPPGNPPRILSQPDETATVDFSYRYALYVFDPDYGDVMTFSLSAAPTGMTIDPVTGLISWTPDNTQLGEHQIGVTVGDMQGFTAFQAFTITVTDPVNVPNVKGLEQSAAITDITAAHFAAGTISHTNDPDIAADFVISHSPSAGAIAEQGNEVNLVVSLGPGPGDIDDDGDGFSENEGDCDDTNNAIHPGASDTFGNGIDENCDGADGELILAEILVTKADPTILAGNTQPFSATGIFTDGRSQNLTGAVTWDSSVPGVAAINSDGKATGIGDGTTTISATQGAISGSTTLTAHAKVPGDVTPPKAAITSPVNDASITGAVDIIGTASDAKFTSFPFTMTWNMRLPGKPILHCFQPAPRRSLTMFWEPLTPPCC